MVQINIVLFNGPSLRCFLCSHTKTLVILGVQSLGTGARKFLRSWRISQGEISILRVVQPFGNSADGEGDRRQTVESRLNSD
jgi:hypothetical protein